MTANLCTHALLWKQDYLTNSRHIPRLDAEGDRTGASHDSRSPPKSELRRSSICTGLGCAWRIELGDCGAELEAEGVEQDVVLGVEQDVVQDVVQDVEQDVVLGVVRRRGKDGEDTGRGTGRRHRRSSPDARRVPIDDLRDPNQPSLLSSVASLARSWSRGSRGLRIPHGHRQ